jgi:uncharacterized membrane protein
MLEQFEDRLMMAVDFPVEIIAGRTLSAYSVSDVQNGQLKLTYAVYNQRELPMDDVQVSVKLATGVGFVQASLPATSSGQDLVWDLGTLPAYGRRSFEVTVSLASSAILQIDEGVRVQGRIDAGLASDTAPAVTLRTSPIQLADLASTIDANALDPVIMEKAAELDYEPTKIFAFLNEQVAYQAYEGALRGARGTLWGAAGNSLDEASLGVALFRASGIPAKYASGVLSGNLSGQLIHSMFPEYRETVGYLDGAANVSNPASDPVLLAIAQKYYWIQADFGNGFVDVDTSGLALGGIGESLTTASSMFAEVPDALRHKVRLNLEAETYSNMIASFGGVTGLQKETVLEKTWNTAELVGRPISIGHFVNDVNLGGVVFSSRALTYTPYFLLGDNLDPEGLSDQVLTGIPFEELLTNFPLSSEVLTGLNLKMEVLLPNGHSEHHERSLVDRIGFAARQTGATQNFAIDANGPPSLSQLDFFTLNVLPSQVDRREPIALKNRLQQTSQYLNQFAGVAGDQLPADYYDRLRSFVLDSTRIISINNNQLSDEATRMIGHTSQVVGYEDRARLVLVSGRYTEATQQAAAKINLEIDLRSDRLQAIVAPGQEVIAERAFQSLRGMVTTEIERQVLSSLAPPDQAIINKNVNSVLFAAIDQNIPVITLAPNDLANLSTRLSASADAFARISKALSEGKVVMVPSRPVTLGTSTITSWYEIDPDTNHTVGVGENGAHVSSLEYAVMFFIFGFTEGVILAGFNGVSNNAICAYVENLLKLQTLYDAITLALSKPSFIESFELALGAFANVPTALSLASGFGFGWFVGRQITGSDPPADGLLRNLLVSPTDSNQSSLLFNLSQATGQALRILPSATSGSTDQNTKLRIPFSVESNLVGEYTISAIAPAGWIVQLEENALTITPAAGQQSGTGMVRLAVRSIANPSSVSSSEIAVNVQPTVPGLEAVVTFDPLLTVPFQGAQLPTGHQLALRNLGPSEENVQLSVSDVTPGWEVILTSDQMVIPAGVRGVRGVYLRPTGQVIPLPGSAVSFKITAISAADSTRRVTCVTNFVLGDVAATVMVPDAVELGAIPGGTVNSMMKVANDGNITETVVVSSDALPTGVSLVGIPKTITLAPGTSMDVPYSVVVADSVPINTDAYLRISLDKRPTGATVDVAWRIRVRVAVPGADAIVTSSAAARRLGEIELASRFDDLATSLSTLVQSPTDSVAKSQSVAAIDAVIQIISADATLSSLYASDLTFSRNQLNSATTLPDIQAALDYLASIITNLSTTLSELVERQFTLSLVSNVITALPGVPAQFQVVMENRGTKATTFDLSVGGLLPFGTIASFNRTSVTLQPGETLAPGPNGITLSLSFTEDFLIPASFTVNATPQEAPTLIQRASASVALREEFLQFISVVPTPSFTQPGGTVDISARLLGVVNSSKKIFIAYQVQDSSGNVVFTSATTPVNLSIRSTTTDVSLPTLDTSSLQKTEHSIIVTATDENGSTLPGVLGKASLQIGTPVSASITVSPTKVFAGKSVVDNSLQIDSRTTPPNPLSLVGQVQTIPTSTTLIVRGELAYVGGTNGLNIVNISDPRNPIVVGTFGQADIVQGGFSVVRELSGNRLLVGTQASLNASGLKLLTYSLVDPLNPILTAQSSVPRQFLSDLFIAGDHAIATTTGIEFFAGNVLNQFGDVSSLNLSNPAAVSISDELYGPVNNIFNHNGGEIADSNTLYVTSTTSNGGFSNTQLGYGVVRVVDTTNLTDLIELRDIRIPDTVQAIEIAIDGNRALVVGSTGGWKSPFSGAQDAQLTGRMTLTLLDITDRRNPFVIGSTLITESLNRPIDTADGGAKFSAIALGNGRFAVGRGYVQGAPSLLVIDTTGDKIVYAAVPVPSMVNEMTLVNGKLYTTSQTGLMIYDVGTIEAIPTTITTIVPHSDEFDSLNRVLVNSFNIPPDQIIDGTGIKTLVWNRAFAFGNASTIITWETELSGVAPNEFRNITQSTEIDFVYQGSSGSLTLPETSVVGQTAIEVLPARQTSAPGATASYDVVLSNPTDDFLTFTISVSGIPSSWIDLNPFVSVNPNSSRTEPLRITAPANSLEGARDFRVIATAAGSLQGVTQATLELVGAPVLPDPQSHGVIVSILPASNQVGQGSDAVYTIRVTNTGSAPEEFLLSSTLPSGFTGVFDKSSINVLPGRDSFQEVRLILTSAIGNHAGKYSFSVNVESVTSDVSSTTQGEIEVLELGATVSLDRTSGSPGEVFQALVTNVGNTAETFDLSVAGPAAFLAGLSTSQLTLQPGQSQAVAVSTLPFNTALPGGLELAVVAKSHTVPTVVGIDSAFLTIPQTRGLNTRFEPSSRTLVIPGTATFQLLVNNTGNTEDAFTATIIESQGAINANLLGLDGKVTQTIPVFRLPAFGQGAILLNASMQTVGSGSVRVQIRSLTDGSIISESIATLQVTEAPVAIADTYLLQQGEKKNLVVLANDQPKGTAIDLNSLQFRDGPQHATIVATSLGQFAWDPNPDYFGADSFSYRYANSQGVYSNWTTVSLEINGRPIAGDNSQHVRRNVETLVDVLANDTDPDGLMADAWIEILTSIDAGQGQLDVVDRKVRFRPTTAFDSSVSFQYQVKDVRGGVSAPATVLLGVYNQNPIDPYDVNRDGYVNAIDALVAINSLNAKGARIIPPGNNTAPFYDVNEDGVLNAIDPLAIINFLNRRNDGEGEGAEGEGADSYFAETNESVQETIDIAIMDLYEPIENRKASELLWFSANDKRLRKASVLLPRSVVDPR